MSSRKPLNIFESLAHLQHKKRNINVKNSFKLLEHKQNAVSKRTGAPTDPYEH